MIFFLLELSSTGTVRYFTENGTFITEGRNCKKKAWRDSVVTTDHIDHHKMKCSCEKETLVVVWKCARDVLWHAVVCGLFGNIR